MERTRNIEQERRNFMAENPDLYAYTVALIEARTWKNAGDITSGASDQYGASNRCYAQAGKAEELRQSLRQSIDYTV